MGFWTKICTTAWDLDDAALADEIPAWRLARAPSSNRMQASGELARAI
jgi:hypothetical protein